MIHRALPALIAVSAASALFFSAVPGFGSDTLTKNADAAKADADSLTISLITCWPGADVYELCGHEALRVRGCGRDSIWNYGTFNFNEPNFIYRFVKGETDYMLSSYPFAWFMPEYSDKGRRVVEQELNLTQDEAKRLLAMIQEEALPQNRTYRYNYVKDNCATRIVERINQAVGGPTVFTDSVRYGTFRNEMRQFHRNYPWYQFGIDLALGSGIDRQLKGQQEMFVPLDMMERASTARLPDGRPLVRSTRVLNEGTGDATLGPTRWWQTPLSCAAAMLLLTIAVCAADTKRRRISRWWWTVYFGLCGIAGCLIFFLVFISEHEATSPNALIVWLNPLQLLTAACVWSRKTRKAAMLANWYNLIAVGVLMLVWPFQPQSANPAFFPLMACAVILGATYAIIAPKESYKIKESAGGTHRASGRKTTSDTGSRKTK